MPRSAQSHCGDDWSSWIIEFWSIWHVSCRRERFSNLMWCKLSHQMCSNHEPSVMNANENVLFLTWNPARQCLQFVIRVYSTNTSCTTISWIFFADAFCSCSPWVFSVQYYLFRIWSAMWLPSLYLFMNLWLYDMTTPFLFLHCSLFHSDFQKRRLGNAVALFATALT